MVVWRLRERDATRTDTSHRRRLLALHAGVLLPAISIRLPVVRLYAVDWTCLWQDRRRHVGVVFGVRRVLGLAAVAVLAVSLLVMVVITIRVGRAVG